MNAIERRLMADPLIASMLRSMQSKSLDVEADAAKSDPVRYKLSTIFAKASYRYVDAGRDGHGRAVRFCWSSHRNVAGYFLGWREVSGKTTTKRLDFYARRQRNMARAIALNRRDAFQAKAAA